MNNRDQAELLAAKVGSRTAHVSIVGLRYVGLPLAQTPWQ